MAEIRLGIIGTGGIVGMLHIPAYLKMPEIEIVGLADPNPAGIAAAKEPNPSLADVPAGCLLAEGIKRLNIGAPTVSHHIRELVDAGLITTSRHGRQLFCAVEPVMRERLRLFFESSPAPEKRGS